MCGNVLQLVCEIRLGWAHLIFFFLSAQHCSLGQDVAQLRSRVDNKPQQTQMYKNGFSSGFGDLAARCGQWRKGCKVLNYFVVCMPGAVKCRRPACFLCQKITVKSATAVAYLDQVDEAFV